MAAPPPSFTGRLWEAFREGFRWWMVPVLVLLVGALVALVVLTGLSTLSAVRYTAL